eukprot:1377487-Alexandrium_andersonii.AAC.1
MGPKVQQHWMAVQTAVEGQAAFSSRRTRQSSKPLVFQIRVPESPREVRRLRCLPKETGASEFRRSLPEVKA